MNILYVDIFLILLTFDFVGSSPVQLSPITIDEFTSFLENGELSAGWVMCMPHTLLFR